MIRFNLQKTIDTLGLSMNKLAVLADVRPNTINDLVKGNSKRIELDTVEKILTALNELSMGRGINKYFQIQDIVQFENENENAHYRALSKKHFELLFHKFNNVRIPSEDEFLDGKLATELLILYGDTLINGIIFYPAPDNTVLEKTLLKMRPLLESHHLGEIVPKSLYSKFIVNETGKEFIRLLKNMELD